MPTFVIARTDGEVFSRHATIRHAVLAAEAKMEDDPETSSLDIYEVEDTEAEEPESTVVDERAVCDESTVAVERAVTCERAGADERAVCEESTVAVERAEGDESTATAERAKGGESAGADERAVLGECATAAERAVKYESTVPDERWNLVRQVRFCPDESWNTVIRVFMPGEAMTSPGGYPPRRISEEDLEAYADNWGKREGLRRMMEAGY